MDGPVQDSSDLRNALAACRGAFIGVALFSGILNLLMLTGSVYMLEVYDRVLPSRSVPTLVGLSILAVVLYGFQIVIDMIRGRVLVRIGASLDEALSARVFDAIVRLPLKRGNRNDALQPLRDLDSVRSFLSSVGPTALFDLPWLPLYLVICFAFHRWIGATALGGAAILLSFTLLTEALTREPTRTATALGAVRNVLADTSRRNAEVLVAMGMTGQMAQRWGEANKKHMATQRKASDVAGGLGSIARVLRMLLQSAILGVGGYLVIQQEATSGIIIAGSILGARALAPIDLAIAHWRNFLGARQSWARLAKLLSMVPAEASRMPLPRPAKMLAVEHASTAPPGIQRLVVHDVSFALKSGNALGVVGPSASGKSSLVRMIVGVWPVARGRISLDGAALDQWGMEGLARHVGYLPQDVELIAGTVAENISRFDPDAKSDDIIAAAQAAGVHELIVGLPSGYETQVGEQGSALSAGQQQRVALARALYGNPFLVVLDEPNSNLDPEGEAALTQAILGARTRGAIVVVVAHRPTALAAVDHVLIMNQGRAQAFGPKDEILSKYMVRRDPLPSAPLKVVYEHERSAQ
jgi:ATP-binding cassette, subfamily C, type I secretion system permease/ATPase